MTDVKQNRDVKLSPNGITPAEGIREIWSSTAAYGVTREDIENPGYWAHVAARLRNKARIEVHAEDGSFYAEYLVINADKTWAKVLCLRFIDLKETAKLTAEQATSIFSGYDVKFRGPRKWSVVRKSDNAVLQEGMHSEEDSRKWLAVHLNAQGIAA